MAANIIVQRHLSKVDCFDFQAFVSIGQGGADLSLQIAFRSHSISVGYCRWLQEGKPYYRHDRAAPRGRLAFYVCRGAATASFVPIDFTTCEEWPL